MELALVIIGALILLGTIETILVIRRRRGALSRRDRAFILTEWEAVWRRAPREPKHALIEADKLIDFALKKRGYTGALGDKLKNAAALFSHIDDVWSAHKLRNRAAHEVGFEPTEREVGKALSAIKQALWDLGIR